MNERKRVADARVFVSKCARLVDEAALRVKRDARAEEHEVSEGQLDCEFISTDID